MITVEEAKRLLLAHAGRMPVQRIPLGEAVQHVTAEAVMAPHDHPLFDCSAVDGYAFAHDPNRQEYRVIGTVPAGTVFDGIVAPDTCVRIFTGAPLPQGADTVVMQERCSQDGVMMHHTDAKLRRGSNVRFRGEQLKAGATALPGGTLLDPAAIGLLASLGVREVNVSARPRVALVITGNEFAQADPPEPGRIFGSNDLLLQAALRMQGLEATVVHVADEADRLRAAIEQALTACDVLITTGGASVGDHDLVMPVLRAMSANVHFHTVAQKPGKPMLFATLRDRPVLGLPGNPRAVLVLFHEYVLPLLRARQGVVNCWPRSEKLTLTHELVVKGDRAEFRAACVRNGRVTLLADEGSHMLRSLVSADGLAYLPAHVRTFSVDDIVDVHFLS